ncbi:MAG: CHAT domain-containing protein, partial [Acidobacteriota bacterium]|nr:CHAT domain-containing protein [Acidobacteriota bacterium]
GGKPVYLVEKHATERIPSALMLRSSPAPTNNGPFLGVADGIYNVADPRWKPASSTARFLGIPVPGRKRPAVELARLVGSSQEIRACARIWQGSQPPMLLTGSQASRAAFQSDLRNRPAVIHLAAHVLSGRTTKDALIDFGLSPEGQPEVLSYTDVANLDVHGATVVVNGCSSAEGRAKFGAGAMGLTRAWLMAGAQTVVGTRWPIPDDTGDLFQSFYSNWRASRATAPANRIVAQSLQQAQLAALHGNTWRSNPKYWSAFYVFGKE